MTGERIIRNEDNDALMPIRGRGFIIGYVDEVNGTGAEEVDSFTPTRHELIQLAKYWENERLGICWFEFVTGQYGSTETRLKYFARDRIESIGDAIGEADICKALDEVDEKFRSEVGERLWQIFCRGDETEWQAVREETWRKTGNDSGQEPAL